MEAIEFKEVTHMIAEHQEEFETLPVCFNPNDNSITSCFELSKEEIEEINNTGKLWLKILNYSGQAILLDTRKENCIPNKLNNE